MKCTVTLVWDSEAKVWFTQSKEIPGLTLESESFDALIEDVRVIAPELLELDCGYAGPVHLIFEVVRIVETSLSKVS